MPGQVVLSGRTEIEALTRFLWRRRTFFLVLAPIVILIMSRPSREGILLGLPFVAVGAGIRLWAAGYLTKLSSLVTSGPYALCRNPMYVGMFLISVGYFVMCGRVEVGIIGSVLFWIFHGGAVAYEEKLLRERFGSQYAEYSRRVPRFLPRLRKLDLGGEGKFSWRQLVANNEHLAFALTVVICALFAASAFLSRKPPIDWLAYIQP